MKKSIALALSVLCLAVFSFGCKGKNDVVATYKSGKVTRGQFYDWLDANRFPKETILKKKAQQSSKIKKMVLDMLIAEEARKAGYDKTEDYVFLFELLKANYYAGYLKKKMSEDASFKEEIAKVSMIKLYVKDYKIEKNRRVKLSDAEVKKAIADKTDKAKKIIADLGKGVAFSELAKNQSDDYSKKDGGDIGYISKDMKGPEFSAVAFSLKKGEYTKEPVIIDNSIYVIKLEDKQVVTEDDLEDVIEDKNKAQRMLRSIQRNKSKGIELELAKASDVEQHYDMISSRNPSTLLYKIGKEEYKVADLNKLIAYIEKKRKSSFHKTAIDDNMKKQMLQKLFNERLLYHEAIKRQLDKDPDFMKSWDVFTTTSLAGAYKNEVVLKDVSITPQEIRDEYEKNKDRLYTRKKKVGGKMVKTVMPFSEVKERIQYILQNKKKSEKKNNWEEALLKDNGFTVIEKELEGE